MNQLPVEIRKRMGRKNASDVFGNMAYALMSNFHLSFEDVCKLPIPMAQLLLKKLNKDHKAMNKKMPRRKR